MQHKLAAVLAEKGSEVISVEPKATVLDAVRQMNQAGIGSVLVVKTGQVVGIFTERDVLRRVVDKGRDPNETIVQEVMTANPIVVGPDRTVGEAMSVITQKRCRHLPVMDGDELVGLISIGDLTRWVTRNQEIAIDDLVRYITGQYPAYPSGS